MARHRGGYPAGFSAFYDRAISPGTTQAVAALLDGLAETLESGAEVLDVGCGGGQNLLALARLRPDLSLTGLDASSDLVTRARARAAESHASVRFVEGTALDLPFPADRVDAVVSFFAIKHWPDRLLGVRECARVLRPGGPLLVTELDRDATLQRWRAFVDLTNVPEPLKNLYARVTLRPFIGRALTAADLDGLLSRAHLTDVVTTRHRDIAVVSASARRPPDRTTAT